METIKGLLNLDRKNRGKKFSIANKKYMISWPLESLPSKARQRIMYHYHSADLPTLEFTPRDQAHDASIAYLKSRSADDLSRLLDERDRGESHVHRGPKTNGTEEVQCVLREPSIKSVERLHHVCKQAELSLRYGNSGRLVYNFSKSLAWNKASGAPRLPSLHLTDFGDMVKESIPVFNDLHVSRNPTPISEAGGWRDLPSSSQSDMYENPEYDSHDSSRETLDSNAPETEWEMQEAKALTVTQIPTSKVRKVQIGSPKIGR
ncbi:hypothetical protein F4820DRAFT_444929 [Hypoxylon rubiginosum]|uniref:Uncharacterized protein n=1 Tax=Hypoxylon rubiginosum TaxID=110542 RepID=A0ACB9ZAQ2_9PEZI|nr:hypothetical protein F4820DRAFT_444929 [Hypoxylon rubiginosum]